MNIYPSILETSIEGFKETFKKELPYFSYFQIDITDGEFVSNKTVTISDVISELRSHSSELTDKSFEFHLMVNNVDIHLNQLRDIKDISIQKILFPAQHSPDSLDSIAPVGIVLNPEDLVQEYWNTIIKFTTVQIMTVTPGGQGLPFQDKCLNKINELRDRGFVGNIILDGGINDKTLPIILKNQHIPTDICPGSYLKEDPENHLRILNKIITNKL